MKVTLFIPTYNEIGGMRAIMPRIKREWVDQILVVDGNSTDGTAEFARSLGYDVLLQKRPGLWPAYKEGWPLIRNEIVITFSPDGNCIPEIIPTLIEKMKEGHDMVVVSRYLDGAKSEDDGLLTGFGNWLFTYPLINWLHGGHFTDAIGIYRAYRTSLYYELGLDEDDGYAPEKFWRTIMGVEVLLSVRALKKGVKIAEIPGDEPARVAGTAKLQAFQWGGAYIMQCIRELWYHR